MSLKEKIDFSDVATPEEANELRANFIRKAFEYDSYADQTRFIAIVLSEPIPLNAGDVKHFTNAPEPSFMHTVRQSLALAPTGPRRISKFAFKARILGSNSPHWFLPDPCDAAYSSDPARALKIIATHTTFISTEDYQVQSGKKLPNRGDLVLVELDKNVFGYNLQSGRFVDVMEATDAIHNIESHVNSSCAPSLAGSFDGRGGGTPTPAPGGMGGGAGTAGIPVPGCPVRENGRCKCGGRADRATRQAHKEAVRRGDPLVQHAHEHDPKTGEVTKWPVPPEGCGPNGDCTFAKCSPAHPVYASLPKRCVWSAPSYTPRQIVEGIKATGAPVGVQKMMYALTKKEQPRGNWPFGNPGGVQTDNKGVFPGTTAADFDYQACWRDGGGEYRIFAGLDSADRSFAVFKKIVQQKAGSQRFGWFDVSDYLGDTSAGTAGEMILDNDVESMTYNYYRNWRTQGGDADVAQYIIDGKPWKSGVPNKGKSGIDAVRKSFRAAFIEYIKIYNEIIGEQVTVAEGGPPSEGDTGRYGSTTIPAE